MPNLVRVTVEESASLLNASMYDAGAVVRLQSCATEAGIYVSVGTAAIVSGTSIYTIYDANGATSTWYRTRYENAGGTVTSDWSAAFQAGGEEAGWICSLADVKQALSIPASDATSDEELTELIAEMTDDLTGYTGRRFIRSPLSGTASFLFDVASDTDTLWIPQGICAITTLEIATTSQPEAGGVYSTATAADYMLRPIAHERSTGWPATQIVFSDVTTGPVSRFHAGRNTVRATAALGWATPPRDVAGIARRAIVKRFKNRGAATVNRGGDAGDIGARWAFTLEDQRRVDWYRVAVVI